jgi:hypothetical protein
MEEKLTALEAALAKLHRRVIHVNPSELIIRPHSQQGLMQGMAIISRESQAVLVVDYSNSDDPLNDDNKVVDLINDRPRWIRWLLSQLPSSCASSCDLNNCDGDGAVVDRISRLLAELSGRAGKELPDYNAHFTYHLLFSFQWNGTSMDIVK